MLNSYLQPELTLDPETIGIRIGLQEAHDKSLDHWIAERHYLRSVPCGARLRLWVLEQSCGNRVIGAMMWGQPTSRKYNQNLVLELTRMYFVDNTERFVESRALALARKYIRKHFPQVKLVMSYSSTKHNDKCGRVFAADNWCPFGYTQGGSWKRKGREDRKDIDTSPKLRWVRSP